MPARGRRFLRGIVDALGSQVAVLDAAGRIVLVNEAWRRFARENGYRGRDHGLGTSYLEVCDRATGEHAPVAAAVAAGLREVAAGRPEFVLEYPFTVPGRRGGPLWFRLRATRLVAGRRAWAVVAHVDVTALKEAEVRGRENEVHRAMIDALPDYVFAKDREGRFLAANAATARALGAARAADLVGRLAADFLPPGSAARYRASDDEVLAGGGPVLATQPAPLADGGPSRHVLTLKAALRDADGRVVGLVGHSRDVTEERRRADELAGAHARLRRQAEEMRGLAEAAERASRAKSEFLAAMSHEIRTPLTAVLGMADLLATGRGLDDAQRRHVEAIRASGRHLLHVVGDVLDFSRIEAGGLELERVDFALPDMLGEVRSLMAPAAVERGLRLEVAAPEGPLPPALRGDPTRLRQVLLNLVGNALKFTREGGVAVRARALPKDGGRVRLRVEVEDTGIGVPPGRRAELFEAFTQADSSTSRRYGGSGLGLAICRRLVGAMGGTIGAEGAPGGGSLFWFEVPLEAGDAAAGDGAAEGAGDAALPPLRLLVAEDVPLNRDLLGDVLGRRGHAVTFAADGSEAVALAAGGGFDLVLMDVQMPVMDGIEATRRIRALPPPAGAVPVVALTANVMEAERRRCLAAGMARVVTKPVAWPELFAAMAAAVGRSDAVEPGPGRATPPSAADVPPLDDAAVSAVGEGMDAATLAGFLGEALAEAGRAHAAMGIATGDPGEVRRLAHRLRGTAGSLGLARVAALAGAIEDAAAAGADATDLVARLGEAVAATREAVASPGPGPAHGSTAGSGADRRA